MPTRKQPKRSHRILAAALSLFFAAALILRAAAPSQAASTVPSGFQSDAGAMAVTASQQPDAPAVATDADDHCPKRLDVGVSRQRLLTTNAPAKLRWFPPGARSTLWQTPGRALRLVLRGDLWQNSTNMIVRGSWLLAAL